jgi:AraC-like DNA-binding protein
MMEMLGTALSVFSNSGDFQEALRETGDVDLIATSGGKFWARMSQIWLFHMSLLACEERLSRIAFVSVSPNMVRVTLPPKPEASLTLDGIGTRSDEIVTHSAGHCFHERTDGPCRWGTIFLPMRDLVLAGRSMRGTAFALPTGERRWRPAPEVLRSLVNLHNAAIRATATRPRLPVERESAHGLEQQLVFALIECLGDETTDQNGGSVRRWGDTMMRFEEALRAAPLATLSVNRIAIALDVSIATLRKCCQANLGMAPGRYLYLRRMGTVRQALHDADPTKATVAGIARLHGFGGRGHFAATYCSMFGELPSVTLRRIRLR